MPHKPAVGGAVGERQTEPSIEKYGRGESITPENRDNRKNGPPSSRVRADKRGRRAVPESHLGLALTPRVQWSLTNGWHCSQSSTLRWSMLEHRGVGVQ